MTSEYKEIIGKVRRLQNGDISDGMKRMGADYKLNFGLSAMQIREIASGYSKNNELAFFLLSREIRETKLLASYLFDTEKLSVDGLISISEKVNNLEMVEYYSKNLFADYSKLSQLSKFLLQKSSYEAMLALYSLGWSIKKERVTESDTYKDAVDLLLRINEESIDKEKARGIYFLMQSIAGLGGSSLTEVKAIADSMLNGTNTFLNKIAQDFLFVFK